MWTFVLGALPFYESPFKTGDTSFLRENCPHYERKRNMNNNRSVGQVGDVVCVWLGDFRSKGERH